MNPICSYKDHEPFLIGKSFYCKYCGKYLEAPTLAMEAFGEPEEKYIGSLVTWCGGDLGRGEGQEHEVDDGKV